MSLSFIRTNSKDYIFIDLVSKLDEDLAVRDGEVHSFYHQYNSIEGLDYVVIVLKEKEGIGCGVIKPYNIDSVEIKRMFVVDSYRGQRIATEILEKLEEWALELGYTREILETGLSNPEAITLYKRCGYGIINNYDQYAGMENSICFAKQLA